MTIAGYQSIKYAVGPDGTVATFNSYNKCGEAESTSPTVSKTCSNLIEDLDETLSI
jgi:hypothetical protein